MAAPNKFKPSPRQATSPVDPAVADAFVHKTTTPPAAAPTPPTEAPAGKLTRLAIDLPPELHRRFKTACAAHGTKMGEEIRKFVEDWTASHGV